MPIRTPAEILVLTLFEIVVWGYYLKSEFTEILLSHI